MIKLETLVVNNHPSFCISTNLIPFTFADKGWLSEIGLNILCPPSVYEAVHPSEARYQTESSARRLIFCEIHKNSKKILPFSINIYFPSF